MRSSKCYAVRMRTLGDVELGAGDRAAIVAAAKVLRERFPVDSIYLFGS